MGSRRRPALALIGPLLGTAVMQGLIEPLHTVRLVMPWTDFGGPYCVPGDPERMLVLVGSPQWYVACLALLCLAGVLLALLRNRNQNGRPLAIALGVALGAAAACSALAMTTGVERTVVNPVASSP